MILDAASYTGGLPLENTQLLRSERAGLVVGSSTIVTAAGASNPTITNASGNALTLASGNTIQGIDLGATNAGSASLAGSTVGTATMNTVTSGSINNATGGAVNISGGTLSMSFAGVSSAGATGDGIRLDDTRGTFTGSGGTLTNAGGQDIDLSGTNTTDDVDFTYGGSITDDLGQLVNVSGQSGGTKDLNGAITDGNDGDGSGISLTNNTGATIRFDGGVILSTGANTAFTATGGGTVVVTGATNSVASTTGTALNVANTTIGARGLTFQSISSNGAPNGIVLNATGTSGGLTVTGDGADANSTPDSLTSGGTIQGSTSDGVSLTSTQDVHLGGMTITGDDADGIAGSGVNGFVLDTVSITANGDQDALDESGINVAGLSGTSTAGAHPTAIRNSTISNNHEFEVQITNSSGTLTDFQVTNSIVSSNGASAVHGNLFNFLSVGSAVMGLTVSGSTFDGNTVAGALTGAGVFVDVSGGTVTADVGTSSFVDNNVAVSMSSATTGNLTFNIHNNSQMTGNRSTGINVFTNGNTTGTTKGTIAGNTVGTQGVPNSGSALGRGIQASIEGGGTTTLLINGNTVQSTNFEGISVVENVTARDRQRDDHQQPLERHPRRPRRHRPVDHDRHVEREHLREQLRQRRRSPWRPEPHRHARQRVLGHPQHHPAGAHRRRCCERARRRERHPEHAGRRQRHPPVRSSRTPSALGLDDARPWLNPNA